MQSIDFKTNYFSDSPLFIKNLLTDWRFNGNEEGTECNTHLVKPVQFSILYITVHGKQKMSYRTGFVFHPVQIQFTVNNTHLIEPVLFSILYKYST